MRTNALVRKLISAILGVAMLVPAFVGSVTAKETHKDYDDALGILTTIGVFEADTEYEEQAIVERETMALYVAKLIGVDRASATNKYFVDVPSSSYGAGAIEYLTEAGVFSQPDDKCFHPEDAVSPDELIKVVTSILGYEKFANVNGGYPTGYRMAANRAGLYVPKNEKVTFGEFVACLESALLSPMYEMVAFGNNGDVTIEKGSETILSVYHRMYKGQGAIEAFGEMSIDESGVGENQVKIGGVTYENGIETYEPDKLGRYVEYYYKKGNLSNEIKYVAEKDNEKLIDIEDINLNSINQSSIEYYDGDRKRKVDISACRAIYNGSVLGSNVNETLKNLNKGSVMLCDTNDDGADDTVVIWDFKNFVVSGISHENGIMSNKLESGGIRKFEDYESVMVYDTSKNKIETGDIKADQLLHIAVSANGRIMVIITSDAMFNGTVDMIDGSGNNLEIVVNGERYTVERSYRDELEALNLTPGQVYTFKTDIYGNICYAEPFTTDGSMKFGYIMDSSRSDETFGDYTIKLKMLCQDGSIKIIDLSDKVRIDGVATKSGSEQTKALGIFDSQQKEGVGKLIRYAMNDEGKINQIDTASIGTTESAASSLTTIGGEKFTERWHNQTRLGLKAYTSETKTFVFCIPSKPVSPNEDDDYRVEKTTIFGEEAQKNVIIYTSSDRNEFVDAVVYKYNLEGTGDNYYQKKKMIMVQGIDEEVDDNGLVVKSVRGFANGSAATVRIPDGVDISNVGVGDIIMFHYGINGQVVKSWDSKETDVIVYYDYSEDKGKSPTGWKSVSDGEGGHYMLYDASGTIDNYRSQVQLSFGYASAKMSQSLWWDGETPGLKTELLNTESVPIVVCDSSRSGDNMIYRGTIDDIDAYDSVGDECSRVILYTAGPFKRVLFVYR